MTWFDLSWVPGFFRHENLDVRTVGPVIIESGRRRPGVETPVSRFVGTFYPVSGEDAEKDDDGQHLTGDASVFSATELPIADNELDPPVPGARLYHHGRLYEFVHKEWWTSGNYYRYTLRIRTHVAPVSPPPPPGGGPGPGGGGG